MVRIVKKMLLEPFFFIGKNYTDQWNDGMMNSRMYFTGVISAASVLYGSKYINTTVRCLCSFQPDVVADSKNSFNIFSEWAKNWFVGVNIPCPVFAINGQSVKVLTQPNEFYQQLLVGLFIFRPRVGNYSFIVIFNLKMAMWHAVIVYLIIFNFLFFLF